MRAESFGYKTAWFAARGVSAEAFIAALRLQNVRRCDWSDGIEAAYDDAKPAVFVTPAIDGWVLALGYPLLVMADAQAPNYATRTAELAARLQTEVQYFATHRVVEAHAWARANASGIERAYGYVGESGEKPVDIGEQTLEERALGFAFFDPESPEAEADDYWERDDLTLVGEEHVMKLAARWSIDPCTLWERELDVDQGWIGQLGAARQRPWWKLW